MAQVMRAPDAVSGSLAECFMTIEGRRYNFMQLINFESSVEISNVEVPILGKTGRGNKSSSWKGTWKGTAHYNQSVLRELLYQFKDSGVVVYFDIQVSNEDPTSSVGRQTVIHKDCKTNGGILAKFDADADYLDEEIEGTFDDFEIPEKFSMLAGM